MNPPSDRSNALCYVRTLGGTGRLANFDMSMALKIAGDSLAFPQDSLLNRWWYRHHLYYALLLQDSVLNNGYTLLDNFVAAHKSTMMPRLDSLWESLAAYNGEDTIYDPESNEPMVYYALMDKLNALQPANSIENNAKQYAKNLLEVKNGSATNEMKGQINSLANQCLFSGGPAVGLARAYLISDSTSLISKNWDDNCTTHARKAIREQNNEEDIVTYDYKIHPTLIGEERRANITLKSEEQGYVELYDIYGAMIAEVKVHEGKNNLILPQNIMSGMVLYKVYVNNKLKRTDKLILISR